MLEARKQEDRTPDANRSLLLNANEASVSEVCPVTPSVISPNPQITPPTDDVEKFNLVKQSILSIGSKVTDEKMKDCLREIWQILDLERVQFDSESIGSIVLERPIEQCSIPERLKITRQTLLLFRDYTPVTLVLLSAFFTLDGAAEKILKIVKEEGV